MYPEARSAMVEKVRKLKDDASAKNLKLALGDSLADWRVEFHIVDASRKDGSFTIPFFSRIALCDEHVSPVEKSYKIDLSRK